MSRPRYDWWGYCKGMIRRYPILSAEQESLQAPTMTAKYELSPHGAGISKPTESGALRGLTGNKLREYNAVNDAINQTLARWDGKERIRLVELVFWKRSHTLVGASLKCNVSERLARQWHTEFIRAVAKNYGLLD